MVIGEWGGWYKTKEDQAWQKALAEFLVKEGFTDQFCAYVRFACTWVCLDPRMPACALTKSLDRHLHTQKDWCLNPDVSCDFCVYTCCCKSNCRITSVPVHSHPALNQYLHLHIYKTKIQSGDTGGLLEEDWETPVKVGTDRVLFLFGFWLCFRFALRCADAGFGSGRLVHVYGTHTPHRKSWSC